jgi:hypothetical protein
MAAQDEGAYEQQEEGNRDQGTENGKRETINGHWATGNRKRS